MHKYESRVKVATSATGDGWTIALGAAESGFQSFADAGYKEGDTFPYAIEDDNGNWEVGIGAYGFNILGLEEHSSQSLGTVGGLDTLGTIQLSDDGTKVFYEDNNSYLICRPLSTAYDPTSIGNPTSSVSIASSYWWLIGDSGRKVYYGQSSGIRQRTLSTPYDLSTAGGGYLMSWPVDINGFNTYYYPISFSDDGTKFFYRGEYEPEYSGEVEQNETFIGYATLSTAWDVTSTVDWYSDLTSTYLISSNGADYHALADITGARFFNDLKVGLKANLTSFINQGLSQYRGDKDDSSNIANTGIIIDIREKLTDKAINAYPSIYGDPWLADDGKKLFYAIRRGTYRFWELVRFDTNCQFNQTSMTRKVISSSNNNNRINLSGSAKVFVTPNQSDFNGVVQGNVTTTITDDFEVHKLDLSSGTFFEPKYQFKQKDQIFEFTNIPEHGAPLVFSVKVAGISASTKTKTFDNLAYDGTAAGLTTNTSIPRDIFFKPDGTELYVTDYSNCQIDKYTLSTAWSLATLSYSAGYTLDTSQHTRAWGLYFKPDGTRLYVTGYNDESTHQYDLSTAWDLSTLSHAGSGPSETTHVDTVGISLSADGKLLFVAYRQGTPYAYGGEIYTYELTTPWDITTAVKDHAKGTSSTSVNAYAFFMSEDGYKTYHSEGTSFYMTVSKYPYMGSDSSVSNPTLNYRKEGFDHSSTVTSTCYGIFAAFDYFFALHSNGTIYRYTYSGSRPKRVYFSHMSGNMKFENGQSASTTGVTPDIYTFIKHPGSPSFYAIKTAHQASFDFYGPLDT